jgi:hypothetical protein
MIIYLGANELADKEWPVPHFQHEIMALLVRARKHILNSVPPEANWNGCPEQQAFACLTTIMNAREETSPKIDARLQEFGVEL